MTRSIFPLPDVCSLRLYIMSSAARAEAAGGVQHREAAGAKIEKISPVGAAMPFRYQGYCVTRVEYSGISQFAPAAAAHRAATI